MADVFPKVFDGSEFRLSPSVVGLACPLVLSEGCYSELPFGIGKFYVVGSSVETLERYCRMLFYIVGALANLHTV